MRVTANTFPNSLIDELTLLTTRQNQLQNQVATGQRVQFPEDDPSAMRRVLEMQSDSSALSQYQSNIASLQQQATVTYNVMNQLKSVSDRIGEISTQADGTKSREELNTYAAEVTQLIQQAVQIANTQYQGNYLLAGTKSDQQPFQVTLDSNGRVTGVTYQGNTSVSENEVAEGVAMSAQTVGANTTGSGSRGLITDSRTGADFFNHMISLQNDLLAGNTSAIAATDRPQLGKDEQNLIFQIATNGALQARLSAASNIASSRSSALGQQISGQINADLATTLVQLTTTQNAYQAALQSAGTILGKSLLDYLR